MIAVLGQKPRAVYWPIVTEHRTTFSLASEIDSSRNCLAYRGFLKRQILLLPQRIKSSWRLVIKHQMQTWVNIHARRCWTWCVSCLVTKWTKQYCTAEVICTKTELKHRPITEDTLYIWWPVSVFAAQQDVTGWCKNKTLQTACFKWHWISSKCPDLRLFTGNEG
jgi:hypothetical protein